MAIASRNYRTLYDVQQLLKEFNVFVYVGDNLYQSGVVDKSTYTKAKIVLRKEHREEQTRI